MTGREREVFVTLVQYIDSHNHWPENDGACHFTPGVDPCTLYCSACAILRDVADDVLLDARARQEVSW